MFEMPSFDMNARPETFVPLIHCVTDDTLSQAMLLHALLQFIDVMNLMSVANVSMHVFMPNEHTLAFNVTQIHTKLSLSG